MCRRSLISRRVLLASILLSNALAIFLIATCSFVSEFRAELNNQRAFPQINNSKQLHYNNQNFKKLGERRKKKHTEDGSYRPDDAISAFANRHNGRLVLSRNFKDVTKDIVLNKSPSMAQSRRNIFHPHRRRLVRRRVMLRRYSRRLRHDGVVRLRSSSVVH